ncbi:hypothetical protein CQA78_16450 [Klebsiella pneumoniae]|nr:hypothetical protein CQA15_10615 [Klebsiella pneumoniae]PCR78918.1 hypothetical protein CQA78_16450 [Klebsiella pneumoniae]
MMSLWDALRMNMMISYQELVRTFPKRAVSVVCPTDTASENTGRCYGLFIKIFVEKCSDVIERDLVHTII